MAYEITELTRWVGSVTSHVGRENLVRRLEALQPALKEDGRRLRGVEVAPGLYLTRRGEFFALGRENAHCAYALRFDEVLNYTSLDALQREFEAKTNARRIPHNK